MKTRILVSGSTLALALVALPAWAGLRIEAAPSQASSSVAAAPASLATQATSRTPSNYQEFGGSAPASAPAAHESITPDSRGSVGSYRHHDIRPVSPTSPRAPAAFPEYVTQSGSPDASASATVSGGTDVMLSDALAQILPAGFTLVDNQVPLRKLATWTGARSWIDVLADLGRAANFVAHVDWNSHKVSLAPAPTALAHKEPVQSPATLSPSVKEVREIREVQTVSNTSTSVPAIPVKPVEPTPPPVATWTLDPSLTLQENVKAWAQKAGWTVVWDAVDYPVFAKTVFQGDFSASTGPLAQVFAGYAGSDQPLLVRLTSRDRVVYVRNRILDRAEVSTLPEPIPDGTF